MEQLHTAFEQPQDTVTPAQRESLGVDHIRADGRQFGEIQGGQIGTQPGEFGAGSGMGEATAVENDEKSTTFPARGALLPVPPVHGDRGGDRVWSGHEHFLIDPAQSHRQPVGGCAGLRSHPAEDARLVSCDPSQERLTFRVHTSIGQQNLMGGVDVGTE
ncbi:hypothetical protein ACIBEH_14930 [Nocardia salmonicida]|uniref:hypothetical protein n=1 Tax=Nocardia salmonicida TaxID=53431 RepID=UPI0037BE0B74